MRHLIKSARGPRHSHIATTTRVLKSKKATQNNRTHIDYVCCSHRRYNTTTRNAAVHRDRKRLCRNIEGHHNGLQNDPTQLRNNASFNEYKTKNENANNVIPTSTATT